MKRATVPFGVFAAALAVLSLAPARAAHARGGHGAGGETLSTSEIVGGLAHGAGLAGVVLLCGLAAFVVLVWLPAGAGRESTRAFGRAAWILVGVLAVAGLVELCLYAVRASGEPFGLGLLWQALSDTRVGHIWSIRLLFATLAALAMTWASREDGPAYWWVAAGLGGVSLLTLTQLSHAAAEGRPLPFLLDWAHAASASAWVGGLLGFPMLLLWPLRGMEAKNRAELLAGSVRRFSRVAAVAVAVIVATGVYAALLHVPSLSALVGTPYGRALIMKLGLVSFMFPIAAINLLDRGSGPLGRMVGAELALAFGVFVATGFLTSLLPP